MKKIVTLFFVFIKKFFKILSIEFYIVKRRIKRIKQKGKDSKSSKCVGVEETTFYKISRGKKNGRGKQE